MSNKKTNKKKESRRRLAQKKAKQKKIIIITICAVVVLAIATFAIIVAVRGAGTKTYTDGDAIVQLHPDGTFSATLYHGESISGTYEISESVGTTLVGLTYNGFEVTGMLVEDVGFIFPEEWLDESVHSHGGILPLK